MAARRPKKVPPEPWGDGRLHLVLGYAYNAHGRRGRVDANLVAEALDVSPGTVRRWTRVKLPAARRAALEAQMLPDDPALEQETRELAYAREALRDIYGLDAPPSGVWREQGWLEPHILAVVQLDRKGICVARIARADGDQKTRARLRDGGGVVVDQDVFPNRFAAQVAKGELLEQLQPWRIVVPGGYLNRGRTEAWLKDAPRHRISWFVDNAELKPPAPRRRRRSTSTRKPT